MPRLFVGNFSFEQQLIERQRVNLPRHLLSLNADYATIWLAVAEPGDVIYAPHASVPDLDKVSKSLGLKEVSFISALDSLRNPNQYELVPWGWNHEMAELATSVLSQSSIPNLDTIRQMNSRKTSFELESGLSCAHPDILQLSNIEEIQQQLHRLLGLYEQVVIKAEYGMSARERILCKQPELTVQQYYWVRHRLEQGQQMFLEPWLDKFFEISTHFMIDNKGDVRYVASTPLLTNQRGEHRGNVVGWDILHEDGSIISDIHTIVQQAAAEISSRGYRGPVSIDSMVYRTGDQLRIRPLQDINARWSMGRMAVEFNQRFATGKQTLWHHFRQDQPKLEHLILQRELEELYAAIMHQSVTMSIQSTISTSPQSFAEEDVRFQTELIFIDQSS